MFSSHLPADGGTITQGRQMEKEEKPGTMQVGFTDN